MKRFVLLVIITFITSIEMNAQFNIVVNPVSVEGDTLLLGYFYAERQYSLDTALRNDNNQFIFSGDKELKGGLFFIHNPRTLELAQFIVDKKTNLEMELDYDAEVKAHFANSIENKIFNNYISFLGDQREETDSIKLLEKQGEISETIMREKLEVYDTKVRKYQEKVIAENTGTLAASIIRVGMEIQIPSFPNDENKNMREYEYYKKHYFDNVDFKDDRLIRTPLLVGRVNNYFDNIVPPLADSVIQATDSFLLKMDEESDMYRYFLVHLVNKYANSKIIGMDKAYVHLVDNYLDDDIDWIDDGQLAKMKDMSRKMKPLLIGEPAPDFTMQNREGALVKLADIEAEYTLLLFWDPDCGHCKKEIPEFEKFFKENQDKNIALVAVCSKFQDKVPECWSYVDEHPAMNEWYVLVDPVHQSRYKIKYNLTSYPMLYILDKDKKIVYKQLKASQLPSLFEYLEQQEKDSINKD